MMIGLGLSLLLFLMGGWMVVMGLRLVRYGRRKQREEGIEPEPRMRLTATTGLALIHLGWINLALLALSAYGAARLFVNLGVLVFVVEVAVAIGLAVVTLRLIEKYLPHFAN
jgi:hypothetical protein